LWIVRLVCTKVVAAEAVPEKRTQTTSSRDAAATFRLRRSIDFLMRLMRDNPESDPTTECRGTQLETPHLFLDPEPAGEMTTR
jgi:hypothetical protein